MGGGGGAGSEISKPKSLRDVMVESVALTRRMNPVLVTVLGTVHWMLPRVAPVSTTGEPVIAVHGPLTPVPNWTFSASPAVLVVSHEIFTFCPTMYFSPPTGVTSFNEGCALYSLLMGSYSAQPASQR